MKKLIFLTVLIAIVSTLAGCYEEPIYCPYGQCLDEYTGYCVPCNSQGGDGWTIPPTQEPVLEWEPVPGHGLIFLHNGAGIRNGINTMTDEYGMVVYVKIASDVYGNANQLATNEMQWAGPWARPLLVTYATMPEPIMVPGYGPIYRFAVNIEICTMCGW